MNINSIKEWREAIKNEVNIHLLDFNDQNFRSGSLNDAYSDDELDQAYIRFDTFLKSNENKFNCSQRALKAFYLQELTELDSGKIDFNKMSAYVGRRVDGDIDYFALKPLKFLEDHMEKFGLEAVSARDIAVEMSNTVRNYSDSFLQKPSGNLRANAKRRINDKLSEIIKEASNSTAYTATMVARSGAPLGAIFEPSSLEFSNDPIWLTSKKSVIHSEAGPVPGEDADVLIKSAYAAGLKECLGLHNPSENLTDRQRAKPVPPRNPADPNDLGMSDFEAFASFAISFLLEIDLSDSEKPCQPCIFSDGYNHLFVSRAVGTGPMSTPEDSMAGRTVKLRDQRCSGRQHGDHCQCGAIGLPEAVLPTTLALRYGAKPVMYSVVFANDLHFVPPEPDMIRKKNV